MSEKINEEVFEVRPNKPNFLLVVILAGGALLLILAAAYVLFSDDGKRLMHGLNSTAQAAPYALPAATPAIAARTLSA